MPNSAAVTFTGKIGPAQQLTAKVFTDIRQFNMDVDKRVLTLIDGAGEITELDLGTITTLTDTITSGNHAITVVNS